MLRSFSRHLFEYVGDAIHGFFGNLPEKESETRSPRPLSVLSDLRSDGIEHS
jgi:hypothetical protein